MPISRPGYQFAKRKVDLKALEGQFKGLRPCRRPLIPVLGRFDQSLGGPGPRGSDTVLDPLTFGLVSEAGVRGERLLGPFAYRRGRKSRTAPPKPPSIPYLTTRNFVPIGYATQ